MLDEALRIIESGLDEAPHPVLKLAAMYVMVEYDRGNIPDWIEALANGNLEVWDTVVEEVKSLRLAEERW